MGPDELKAMVGEAAFTAMSEEQRSGLLSKFVKPPEQKKTEEKDKDLDLGEKARLAREADEKRKGDTKALESALKFNMGSAEFLKQHETILPTEMKDIFVQAEKETYSSAIEKEADLKAGMIQTFFKLQANVDLLTASMKTKLEDYLKLTKTGKQEKAIEVYESVFEPGFAMLMQIKKADALNKAGGSKGTESDGKPLWQKNLIERANKRFLGEK